MGNINTEQMRLSSVIGFYNMVFCSNLKGYAKCWLDGFPEYTLFRYEEILDFASKDTSDKELAKKVKHQLAEALSETSIFVWVVDSHIVKRLSASSAKPDIGSFVNSVAEESRKSSDSLASSIAIGWRNELSSDKNGNISLKF